ncbi:MAG: XdhC family protein, partial [Deltaproteobacteria bacterium]|nr:XdhC family protein [Deltaproteobacteria bacterium]
DALPEELRAAVADVEKKEHSMRLQHRDKTFFLQAFMPNPQLVIVGAVHIAGALADIARIAGYRVVIIDPRGAFATAERFPGVHLEVEWPDEILQNMPLHSRTAIVTLTHDPKLDDPALELALRSNAFYIGALGSRKTHAARLERLADAGVDRESLKRIHAPVGLDIGADNPAEIAIAIMAQITEKRRKGKQPERTGCWEDKQAGGLTVLCHTISSAVAPAKAR